MTQVVALDPEVAAVPGQVVACRIRVVNDDAVPRAHLLAVVGIHGSTPPPPVRTGSLAPGEWVDVVLEVPVPEAFPAGRHALAVRVTSDPPTRADANRGAGLLAPFTVVVSGLDRLSLAISPSSFRARRSARFNVGVHNGASTEASVALSGEGVDLAYRFNPPHLTVRPGERAIVRGRVTSRNAWVSDPTAHVVTVTASEGASPAHAQATFVQKPMVALGLRAALVALTLLLVWGAILGYTVWRFAGGDDEEPSDDVELASGEAGEDGAGDDGQDGGAGQAGGAGGEDGGGGDGGSGGQDGEEEDEEAPSATILRGTAKASETGDDAGIRVRLVEAQLTDEDDSGAASASLVSMSAEGAGPVKLWPSRHNTYLGTGVAGTSLSISSFAVRQTQTIEPPPFVTTEDGNWQFSDVPLRRTYELGFAKEGFDNQSFIVSPPDDGSPLDLDLVLEPASGRLGGTVTSGGAPLGGVDLTISDGTLDFRTTTSTASANTGTWAVERVSTPATYTIIASKAGYGSEVAQVALDPGAANTGIRMDLTSGVGSVSGHIRAGGQPIGGITVTATGGDVTRTTTSLTEGDRGLFSFPQLPIPATYTIAVTADGYITQTREIFVGANVAGVDFDLAASTGTVTGLVTSDHQAAGLGPGPVGNAAVLIARDELEYRTTTAATGDVGTFTVSDLPPGQYTVTISRYDQSTETRIVELTAGQVTDLGEVRLTFGGPPPVDDTGTLVVEVVDSTGADLTGATVTIWRVADFPAGDPVFERTDTEGDQASFTFDEIRVGTYIVSVTRPNYQRVDRRVTTGIIPVTEVFTLLKLGQVTGRVVNSLDPSQQLTNYIITLFLRLNDGRYIQQGAPINVPANQQPDADGNILFQSPPTSLVTGVYRLEVTRPPPGFVVVADQVLDDRMPAGETRVMHFEIRPEDEDVIRLNDIEADPYPELRGRVLVPNLQAPPSDVEFVAIEAAPDDLAVTLTCPANPDEAIPAVLISEVGGPGLDTFVFDPLLIEREQLLGQCTLNVTAAGYTPANIVLTRPLAPSDGNTSGDQFINVALVAPATVGGEVFWIDAAAPTPPPRRVPAVGVDVRVDGPVIIGFDESQSGAADQPTPVTGVPTDPLSTSGSDGRWRLDGQVFGQGTYVFEDPDQFETGTLTIVIDEDGRQIAATESLTVTEDTDGDLLVEMEPLDGSISGTVSILTSDPTPAFGAVGIKATDAGNPSTVDRDAPDDGDYRIDPATPGTYSVEITAPEHHLVLAGSVLRFSGRLEPNQDLQLNLEADTTLYELGYVDVTVTDSATPGKPIVDDDDVTPTITLHHVDDDREGDPRPGSREDDADPISGEVSFLDVAVNTSEPVAESSVYLAEVSMPGYDVANAVFTITDRDGTHTSTGARSVNFAVSAGDHVTVTVAVPKHGSITGTVTGRRGAVLEAPSQFGPLTVTATRLTGDDPGGVPVDISEAGPGGSSDSFVFGGVPGCYQIVVTHPQYAPVPVVAPLPQTGSGQIDEGCPPGSFRIANDTPRTLTPAYELDIVRATVDVSVLADLTDGGPVDGARVTLSEHPMQLTDGAGFVGFTAVVPGEHMLTITRRADDGDPLDGDLQDGPDLNFPLTVTLTVPRGTQAAPPKMTVRAPLPLVGGALDVTVTAFNQDDQPVTLPPDVRIDRFYLADGAEVVGGATVPNTFPESGLTDPPDTFAIVTPATPDHTASFTGLPFGVHRLEFSDETASGYDAPADQLPPVVSTGEATDVTVRYTAANRSVVVKVTSDLDQPDNPVALQDLNVVLTSPDGEDLTPTRVENTFTFAGVRPKDDVYLLDVRADLHEPIVDQAVTVGPGVGDITPPAELHATQVRIQGLARKQTATQTTDLDGEGTVNLYRGATLVTSVTPPTPEVDSGENYEIVVPQDGDAAVTYRVEVVLDGYATRTTDVEVRRGGQITAATLTVPAEATATVTVSGPDADATEALETDATLAVTMNKGGTIAGVRNGRSFTFAGLDPDVAYRWEASATGYADTLVPELADFDPDVGVTEGIAVTLKATVTVRVTTEGSTADATRADVFIRFGSPGNAVGQVATKGDDTEGNGEGGEYVLALPGPPTDEMYAVARRTGYRTRSEPIPAGNEVTVRLLKRVTINGTVTTTNGMPVAQVTVTAAPGATAVTDAQGRYQIDDLPAPATYTPEVTYKGVTAEGPPVDVTSSSSSTATSDITVGVLEYRFLVRSGGANVSGAEVTMGSQSPATGTNGRATIVLPASATNLKWTVTKSGFTTETGTATRDEFAINVTLAVTPPPTTTTTTTARP